MKEQLISFETAKLAKEKGFDWRCLYYYYNDDSNTIRFDHSILNQNAFHNTVSAPTQSLLQRWLMENKKLFIKVDFSIDDTLTLFFCVRIYCMNTCSVLYYEQGYEHNTYEQALEAGLIEALKLI